MVNSKKKRGYLPAYGSVAVVGGGVAGTAAAVELTRRGFDVSLFESRAALGGRCAAIEFAGAKLDNATHAMMGCYENFFGFVKTLGTFTGEFFAPATAMDFISANSRDCVEFAPKHAGFFSRVFSFFKYLKLPPLRSASNVALFLKIRFGMGTPLENETAAQYLSRMRIPDLAAETFWIPFCVSALNTPIQTASATAMVSALKKSILKNSESGRLYFPVKPIAEAIAPAKNFVSACGGKVFLNCAVEKIETENSRAKAVVLKNGKRSEFDYVVVAVPPKICSKLLDRPEFAELAESPIENVYFTTRSKLLDSDYACLLDSPLHWIFNHSNKLPDFGKFLYGVTISAWSRKQSKDDAAEFVRAELSKIFGQFEIDEILPSTFAAATLSADVATEKARFFSMQTYGIGNLKIIGDWTYTGLPATIESAAKSAQHLKL